MWCTIVQRYSFKKVSSTWTNQRQSRWTINQYNQSTRKTVPRWLLRALTYHLKGMPYREFLPELQKMPWIWIFLNKRWIRQQNMHYQKQRKINLYQSSHWLMMNMMRYYGTGSQCLVCRLWNGLEGQVIWWGMTGLAHSAWGVGSKMAWRCR